MKDLEKKILDYKKIFKDEEEKKLQLEDKLNNYEIQFESLEVSKDESLGFFADFFDLE